MTEKKKSGAAMHIIGAVLCVVFGFFLVCNIIIIVKGTLHPETPPTVLGVAPMVVLSGSMSGTAEDHIEVGDLIFTKQADIDELKVGDVVAFMDGSIVVTHRIVSISADRSEFVTKGDANNTEDEPISADQIIGQYETMKAQSDAPVFLHAVTMQNHTNYNKDNYPDDQRVKVTEAPAGLKASTVGALEDFATGIRDADAMLGKLTAYFSQVDEPVILVFWGDHYNPIDSNYDVYTTTGYASDSSADPRLHQTTLLMWSNYSQQQVDLGTIAAYDISPVMMDIYGLEAPLYFQSLNRGLRVASRTNTRGTTMNLDGTTTQEPTEFQQRWSAEHWLLQYDLMFGRGYALQRMGLAGLSGVDTGK